LRDGGELRLTAGAPMVYDKNLGNSLGRRTTKVFLKNKMAQTTFYASDDTQESPYGTCR
jgi:hypothetical protein